MNAVVPDMQQYRTLDTLLCDISGLSSFPDRPVGRLRTDSREVEPGDVFFALPGRTVDGRDHIDDALARGAGAVLYEQQGTPRSSGFAGDVPVLGVPGLPGALGRVAARYFGFPSQSMHVVGVTGTNGKTTTAYLVAQALDQLGMRCGYSGTVGSAMAGEAPEGAALTTPGVIGLHRLLSQYRDRGAQAMALEVSSHGLDQDRTQGVAITTGVFTNLTRDHLDYHGSMERYRAAKRRLFENPDLKYAVVNADDAFGQEIRRFCDTRENGPACIAFGLSGQADLRPENIRCDHLGITFDISCPDGRVAVRSDLIGRVNVLNLAAVAGVLSAMEVPVQRIGRALEGLRPPPGRMEMFCGRPASPCIVVDYAHTPDALEQALVSLREICRGKLVAVFGCGGDRDRSKRAMMGSIAERHADDVILTDDNPRSEFPRAITDAIAAGMRAAPQVIHDRVEAARHAISACGEADIILLAGKGHEQTQTTGGEVRRLCDREFVPELLGGPG